MEQKKSNLSKHWKIVSGQYKLLNVLGEGTFGKVIQARHRVTKQDVAIKFINTKFEKQSECRNILREISILKQFSQMNENIFVSKLYEVIVASEDRVSLKDAQGIFIVMEYVPNDIKKLLLEVEPNSLKEKHALIIIYNLLCAANYIHSANIMHRDIKPANLLINHSCQISLCDFGQARCVPTEKPLLQDKGK